jgi:hypothetical protein
MYSFGTALLDLDEPWKMYECVGDTDTVMALAFAKIDEVLDFVKPTSAPSNPRAKFGC